MRMCIECDVHIGISIYMNRGSLHSPIIISSRYGSMYTENKCIWCCLLLIISYDYCYLPYVYTNDDTESDNDDDDDDEKYRKTNSQTNISYIKNNYYSRYRTRYGIFYLEL